MYKIFIENKEIKSFNNFESAEDYVINFYKYKDEDEISVKEIVIKSGYYSWVYIKNEDSLKFRLLVKNLI